MSKRACLPGGCGPLAASASSSNVPGPDRGRIARPRDEGVDIGDYEPHRDDAPPLPRFPLADSGNPGYDARVNVTADFDVSQECDHD